MLTVYWGARGPRKCLRSSATIPSAIFPFPAKSSITPVSSWGPSRTSWESAKRLCDLEFVHGLDLLAYRFDGDVPELMRQVCQAANKPVVVAGSIDREERVAAAAQAGAAGFTVGTAAFAENFPAEGEGLTAQVQSILAMTGQAIRLSSSPRRIALVAHNARKTQLLAWVGRHLKALKGQKLICTGGTGALLLETYPELSVQRLQRGSHGGDQQLGALVATGELDAVIFFIDPEDQQAQDVDFRALTRLAILHDTPIACSPAGADLFVAASLEAGRDH